jgi:hypothetical protein
LPIYFEVAADDGGEGLIRSMPNLRTPSP